MRGINEEVARLLADARRFPVLLLYGGSTRAYTLQYRLLPSLVRYAFCLPDARTPASRPAAVRVVSLQGAVWGPVRCAEAGAFVEVLQPLTGTAPTAPADVDTEAAAVKPKNRSGGSTTTEEGTHQDNAQAFTHFFLSQFLHQTTQHFSGGGSDEDEAAIVQDAEAAAEDLWPPPTDGGEGGNDGKPWVHWVVPLLASTNAEELRGVLRAWRRLLSGSLRCETATVVLFVARYAADQEELVGSAWGAVSVHDVRKREFIFADSAREVGAACWQSLGKSSLLQRELLRVASGGSFIERLTCSAHCADPTAPSLRLPAVACWKTSGGGGAVAEVAVEDVATLIRRCWATHERLRGADRCRVGNRNRRTGTPQVAMPAPVPSWQWLLPVDAPNKVPECAVTKAVQEGRGEGRRFAYTLVPHEAARRAEQRRAVQRNRVGAMTLRLMRASAQHTSTIAPGCGAAPFAVPQPRYYAPVLADGGSPLTVDGCLTDIFVLEFTPHLATGDSWIGWLTWLRTHPPAVMASRGWRGRYRAMRGLLAATEAFMADPVPSKESADAMLHAALTYIRFSGRGRGVLAWPLIDPREGPRRPRLAFTLTYEFFSNPLRYVAPPRSTSLGGAEAEAASEPTPIRGCDNEGKAAEGSSGETSRQWDVSAAAHLRALLRPLRSSGWILVWQEDHRRWPTAVPPPCMSEDIAAATTTITNTAAYFTAAHRFDADASWRAANAAALLPGQVAAELEAWRRKQAEQHNVRYNLDATALSSHALPVSAARRTPLLGERREPGLHHPSSHPSPFTSLAVWQAGVVAEPAGMYLWEGQTVFLDSGQCGTVVDFRPPPAELLLPWSSQPTREAQLLWRRRQRQHAAFLRYHRWRRRLLDHDRHPHHLAAAFTALPSHVVQREQDLFPVVRLWHDRTTSQEEVLVHVLPTRVTTLPVRYPTQCVVSAAEQEEWLAAHAPHAHARRRWPLRDESWVLNATRPQQRSELTVLSLPLAPHRVETCASFLAAHALDMARHPVQLSSLPTTMTTGRDGAAVEALCTAWTRLHLGGSHGGGTVLRASSVFDRVTGVVPFGHICWPSFFRTTVKGLHPV